MIAQVVSSKWRRDCGCDLHNLLVAGEAQHPTKKCRVQWYCGQWSSPHLEVCIVDDAAVWVVGGCEKHNLGGLLSHNRPTGT